MYEIGQTVKSSEVTGHVVFATGDVVHVRDATGTIHPTAPSTLTLIDEASLPLEGSTPASAPTPVAMLTPRVGTKLLQCTQIYQSMTGASRKDVIAAFVLAGCTLNGASTYYSNIKSSLSRQVN